MSAASTLELRDATPDDLAAILALLHDDPISRSRAGHRVDVDAGTRAAFERIAADPAQRLWVGDYAGEVVATLQLSLVPGISRGGMTRCIVEAVQVRRDLRGRGLGETMMRAAMDWARAHGAGQIQLTSDLRRVDAHRFYARLGFEATHVGMKRLL